MATTDSALSRAVDRAVAAENKRAIAEPYVPAPLTPVFPPGTPEYEAYAAELRHELALWVAGEGEYARA